MTERRRTFDREFKLNAVEMSYKRENIRELASLRGLFIARNRSAFIPDYALELRDEG